VIHLPPRNELHFYRQLISAVGDDRKCRSQPLGGAINCDCDTTTPPCVSRTHMIDVLRRHIGSWYCNWTTGADVNSLCDTMGDSSLTTGCHSLANYRGYKRRLHAHIRLTHMYNILNRSKPAHGLMECELMNIHRPIFRYRCHVNNTDSEIFTQCNSFIRLFSSPLVILQPS